VTAAASEHSVVNHPVIDQLDKGLRDRIPGEPVELAGEWSKVSRRTYTSEAQLGTASRPFRDVVDVRWRGTFTGTSPIGGMAFLVSSGILHWAKAPVIASELGVDVSLHAYAEYMTDRATFTASLAGAYLPGMPVSVGPDLAAACTMEPGVVRTGRVSCIARVDAACFFVLLLPRGLLTVGRKRLWRVRDEMASTLPAGVRELLTHRRTGRVPSM
jgi:hypothetical protein